MASQTPAGDRTLRTPPVPAAKSYERKCVVLADWWLERMDGKIYIAGLVETPQRRKGGFPQGNRKSAARVFKGVIARMCDSITVETVNGYVVLIKGTLNNSRMVENGFCEEMCKSFMGGFPIQWKKLVDSNMEHIDEHSQSPSNSADDVSVEQYLEKFMNDSFVSKGYSFAEYSFSSFGNLAFSDLGEPQTPKCRGTSVNLGAENAGMIQPSGSVRASEKNEPSQSPPNSADDVLVEQYLEKFMSDSFVSKGYSFAESRFSSFRNLAFSDLGEPQTPKYRGTSVNLGAENASEVPAAGMIRPSGSVRASEKNDAMTLRSGRVLGGPISAPMTGGNKWKRSQHKASKAVLKLFVKNPDTDAESKSCSGIFYEESG